MKNIGTWTICVVLAGATLLTCGLSVPSQTAEVPVVKVMVAPYLPRIAAMVHAGGSVVVDVDISSEGKVTSAHVVEGHPFLTKAVEKATQQWTFEPGAGLRKVRLTFVYPKLFAESTSVIIKPYEVTLISGPEPPPETVSLLPTNFREGKTRCRVHGILLKTDRVQIIYGLMGFKVGYLEAEKKLFPNSHKKAFGGCLVEATKFAEVAYCPKCRRAESKWGQEHRHVKRYI